MVGMPDHSDVVIAGAGIIGASIAWRLAQAGAVVTLLDAGGLGGEASWAGAGMLAPGGEYLNKGRWASFALESLALYPAFVAALEREAELPIDLRRCGALETAADEAEWQELLARRATQAEFGIRAEITPGGVFYPDDALVDPRDVTRALRAACGKWKVRIVEQARVSQIRVGAESARIETAEGAFSAPAAVLAAGAWSSSIPVANEAGPVSIPRSFPVRGHLLGFHLPPGSVPAILRQGHTYVMQRSSGFVIAGTSSEEVGFDRDLDPAVVAEIHRRATRLLPALRTAAEPTAWLGFRPATENYEPVIERLPGSCLWLAYGHYRNGILLTPATAALVAGEIRAGSAVV